MKLIDFTQSIHSDQWEIVNDAVMGGCSDGQFSSPGRQSAVFQGTVSLENNGGFTLVRRRFDPLDVSQFGEIKIRLRGDGKRYQFRVKSDAEEKHAYIQYFDTTGDWQTVILDLADQYPTYKGRRLDLPNYSGQVLSEVGFLIGNGNEVAFRLELKSIDLV